MCKENIIYTKNMMQYAIHCTNCRTEMISSSWRWSEWTKRRVHDNKNITELKKYGCVCTCCRRNDLPWYNCVIFVKHNYNLNISAVANALLKQYQEIRQKEFICKSCHKELKDGKYSKNVQNCPNSNMFGSNINDDQNGQHNEQENRIHNENNIISEFQANYTSQITTLTNYCLCTCCHKTDIPRSQCIIFKESKYNYDNTVVVEALSHRFSVSTSKEYICRKCDKDLLEEIMPMDTVASWFQLTSNEPQQKCIHCNIVCIEKFLTFNKTKYGQNTIVSQMIENNAQNIICNKCHNAICRESLVTCLICTKTVKKVYIEIWYQHILLTRKQHTRNDKITESKLLHMQKLPCRTATKNYMCVL